MVEGLGWGVSTGSLTWVTLLNEYLAGMSLGRRLKELLRCLTDSDFIGDAVKVCELGPWRQY